MTVVEAGARGGRKIASTHRNKHYQKIGRMGGLKNVVERGVKFYSGIGRKGGIERGKQREGSKEAEGKISLEEAGHRGIYSQLRKKQKKESSNQD